MPAMAQSAREKCQPASVIPRAIEPPAKIVIDPPLTEPLAERGVVIIYYCPENLHIVPVFGPNALTVSPRVGHLHVSVDDSSWRWADASGNPIIIMGLAPGPHKVLIELEDNKGTPIATLGYIAGISEAGQVLHLETRFCYTEFSAL
jgi:hypothetical protein